MCPELGILHEGRGSQVNGLSSGSPARARTSAPRSPRVTLVVSARAILRDGFGHRRPSSLRWDRFTDVCDDLRHRIAHGF